MAGSMSLADLRESLRSSLMDAAGAFADDGSDFDSMLAVAAADMHRVRARTLVGSVALIAGIDLYDGPADMQRFKSLIWGRFDWLQDKPWNRPNLTAPKVRQIDGQKLMVSPTPNAEMITAFGAECRFFYVARDVIGQLAEETTIQQADRHMLLLRAQVEAMHRLSLRDSVRPVQLRDGFSGQAKIGTPAALADSLMTAWLLIR